MTDTALPGTPIVFHDHSCRVQIGRYAKDRLAISLMDAHIGEPIARAAANLPDEMLAADEVCLKSWGENEGLAEILMASGIVQDTGRRAWAGRVSVPVCRLVGRGA